MIRLRFLALQALRSRGYEIRRVAKPSELQITDLRTDPIELEYKPMQRRASVFDVALQHCRGFHAFGLRLQEAEHPFVKASAAALRESCDEARTQAITAVLSSYYRMVTPASALDVVGMAGDEAPGLVGVEPLGYNLPWWDRSLAETQAGRARSLKYIGMRYGARVSAKDGHTLFGPVRESKLSMQAVRLLSILSSVRKKGFTTFNPKEPTKVVALRRDGEYRWFIDEGQHRFAIASALGIHHIPAVITMIVRREDAAFWPQVVNGVFTARGAESLFDRIFNGNPPPVCSEWIRGGQSTKDRSARSTDTSMQPRQAEREYD